jgi:hypothetical protein
MWLKNTLTFLPCCQIRPFPQQCAELPSAWAFLGCHAALDIGEGRFQILSLGCFPQEAPVDPGGLEKVPLLRINPGHGRGFIWLLWFHRLSGCQGAFKLEDEFVGTDHTQFLAGNTLYIIRIALKAIDAAIHLQVLASQRCVGFDQPPVGIAQAPQFHEAIVPEEHDEKQIEHGKNDYCHQYLIALAHRCFVPIVTSGFIAFISGSLNTHARIP